MNMLNTRLYAIILKTSYITSKNAFIHLSMLYCTLNNNTI